MNIPVYRPYISEDLNLELLDVLNSGYWTGGKRVDEVEELIANTFNFSSFICTNSGTSALEIAFDVLFEDTKVNVVVPVNTFATTAEVPKRLGHNVIFCDVDPVSGMININHLKDILDQDDIGAVLPVSIAGFLYRRKELLSLKDKYGFKVIEDFAQLIYPHCKDENIDATFFSFYPNKILSTPDGGGVVFSDPTLVEKAKKYRLHGVGKKDRGEYDLEFLGRKANMTDLVAVILKDQLKILNKKFSKRKYVYEMYINLLDTRFIQTQELTQDMIPSLFIIHVSNRNELRSFLADNGVQTSIHFKPLHQHSYWRSEGTFKGGDMYYETALSLPFFELLTNDEIEYITSLINEFYSS